MASTLDAFVSMMIQAPSAFEVASRDTQEALAVMALQAFAPTVLLATALAVFNAGAIDKTAALTDDTGSKDPQRELMHEEMNDKGEGDENS